MIFNINRMDKKYLYYYSIFFAFFCTISNSLALGLSFISLLYFMRSIYLKQEPFIMTNVHKGIYVYISSIALAMLMAKNKMLALDNFYAQLEPIFIFLGVTLIKWDKNKIKTVLIMMFLGIFINSLYVNYQWFFLGFERPVGFSKSTIVLFSEFTGLILPIILFVALETDLIGKNKKIILWGTIPIILGVLWNGIKMIWLILLFWGIIYFVWKFSKNDKRLNFIILAILVLAISSMLSIDVVRARIMLAIDNPGSFLAERIILWKLGIAIFKDNFLLGIGPGNYGDEKFIYFKNLYASNAVLNSKIINSHNNFIQILAEQGIVGILAVIYMFKNIFEKAFVKLKSADLNGAVIIISTISLLVAGISEATMFYRPLMRIYWFIIAIASVAELKNGGETIEDRSEYSRRYR